MQEITNIMPEHPARLGLLIHRGKTKMQYLQSELNLFSLSHIGRKVLEQVRHFTYLGSIVDTPGG